MSEYKMPARRKKNCNWIFLFLEQIIVISVIKNFKLNTKKSIVMINIRFSNYKKTCIGINSIKDFSIVRLCYYAMQPLVTPG
jgi:hypothetical protein